MSTTTDRGPAVEREREELIVSLLPLARRLANRYRNSGESMDDLEQVAYLGLVKAVDRYDPDRGPIVRYAVPTILGELRRHFRDKGWGTHVTRPVQENLMRVNAAFDDLGMGLGRVPTTKDIAAATGIALEDVIEAMEAARSYRPTSLDAPVGTHASERHPMRDLLGEIDPHYGYVDIGVTIGPAFRALPERERRIVELRFFQDLTQSEIAAEIGISQMHVSRLLRRALDTLHRAAGHAAAA
jgi:RNA polymerase sigma-B factor